MIDALFQRDSFLRDCAAYIYNLLSNATIDEISVEPIVPKPQIETTDPPSSQSPIDYRAHPNTQQLNADLLWCPENNALALSSRLALVLYLTVKPSLTTLDITGTRHQVSDDGSPAPPLINFVTFICLIFNGDSLAALTLRARLFSSCKTPTLHSVSHELSLIKALLGLHPKANLLWIYRRYILRLTGVTPSHIENELRCIQAQAIHVSHNYYSWVHWLWLTSSTESTRLTATTFADNQTNTSAIDVNPALLGPVSDDQQFQFLQQTIGLTPFHAAPYHHLYILLDSYQQQWALHKDQVQNLCKNLLILYPDCEAAWLFRCLVYIKLNLESQHAHISATQHTSPSPHYRGWKSLNDVRWRCYYEARCGFASTLS